MEPARQEVAGQMQVVDKVLAEGKEAVAGWRAIGLEPAPAGSVFALIVERDYPIKWELPAIT